MATTGVDARRDITNILQRFGCERIGFMDDYENRAVELVFAHRGRTIRFRADGAGWARMYLKENPWSERRRIKNPNEYEARWLAQGQIAVNSMLRDYIKGMIVAVESGLLPFDEAFLPQMLTGNGQTVLERLHDDVKLLPEATAE